MKKKNTGKIAVHEKEDNAEVKLRIWMLRNNINMIKIAKGYGSGRAFVSQFIQGQKTSKGLAKFIIDMGCPEEYFKDGKLAKSDSSKTA